MQKKVIGAVVMAAALGFTFGVRQIAAARVQAAQPSAAQARPDRLGNRPNFNGLWQTINSAYWNVEAHNAEAAMDPYQYGALGVIPAGKSVIQGDGKIPYLPDALKKRDENRSGWPANDPEAKCYMLGIPRATYYPMPFQIFQGAEGADMLMVYPFAAMNRVIYMQDKKELPVDSWMGKSMGAWDGQTLVITTINQNDQTWLDRAGNHHSEQLKVTERFTLMDSSHIRYQATLEDPKTYSRPWTMEMVLYRVVDPNMQLLEHKCVPFAELLLYRDLLKPGQ